MKITGPIPEHIRRCMVREPAIRPNALPMAAPAALQTQKQGQDRGKASQGLQSPIYETDPQNPRQTPALERNPGDAPLAPRQVQKGGGGKIHVRIESVRRRLADPDGLCEKYVLDCCRYAGLIPDDSPEHITLETTQRKAGKGEEEHTLIEIERPNL